MPSPTLEYKVVGFSHDQTVGLKTVCVGCRNSEARIKKEEEEEKKTKTSTHYGATRESAHDLI